MALTYIHLIRKTRYGNYYYICIIAVCAPVSCICIQDMTCRRVYAGMCDPLLGINGLNNISLIT